MNYILTGDHNGSREQAQAHIFICRHHPHPMCSSLPYPMLALSYLDSDA